MSKLELMLETLSLDYKLLMANTWPSVGNSDIERCLGIHQQQMDGVLVRSFLLDTVLGQVLPCICITT